ncbi:MAG: phosphatidylserine decarboxylase [Treponema sp.]|jgi:phosphatidylserine decarboxylase|nr:phosphatidylserine decarboxylase [Treponema sp.]
MDLFGSLSQYVQFYPLAALAGLFLAGCNIPLSEDLIIITGALICQARPALLVPSLLALYVGVIGSDFLSYYIGTLIRKGAIRAASIAVLLSPANLERVHRHLDRHGFLTFIICRFIPFGARNTLFMASGFLGLPLRRFALYDITAALISVNTIFFLAWQFGDDMRNPIRVAGIALSALLALTVLALLVRFLVRRFPLTKYGLPQAAVFPSLAGAAMAAAALTVRPPALLIPLEAALFLVLLWMLSFFRNPPRTIVRDESALLSPADGTVTDISTVDDEEFGPLLRIGIFLSIFNVHLNRVPCSVRIDRISYKKGMFRDARSPESTRVNESNTLLMTRLAEPRRRLLVRQVSGAIARHIVCGAKAEDELEQGTIFGMIKFGSRTELYLSAPEECEMAVRVGDKVRAGLDVLARYR